MLLYFQMKDSLVVLSLIEIVFLIYIHMFVCVTICVSESVSKVVTVGSCPGSGHLLSCWLASDHEKLPMTDTLSVVAVSWLRWQFSTCAITRSSQACPQALYKPIIGCHVYITDRGIAAKSRSSCQSSHFSVYIVIVHGVVILLEPWSLESVPQLCRVSSSAQLRVALVESFEALL